jgi:hypothetical protein
VQIVKGPTSRSRAVCDARVATESERSKIRIKRSKVYRRSKLNSRGCSAQPLELLRRRWHTRTAADSPDRGLYELDAQPPCWSSLYGTVQCSSCDCAHQCLAIRACGLRFFRGTPEHARLWEIKLLDVPTRKGLRRQPEGSGEAIAPTRLAI